MTYTIGMVSQKGGVGKSTLARMMAREFVAGGLTTKIADLDTQQQTCAHWAGRRAENGVTPEMQVQSFASVKTALEDAPRFDALILDGKPNASEQTVDIAKAADLIVIPTGRRLMICIPASCWRTACARKASHPRRSPLPCSRPQAASAKTSPQGQYLAEAGYLVLDGEVSVSTAYGSASDMGKAITETSFRTLNDRAAILAQSVIDKMAELQERQVA